MGNVFDSERPMDRLILDYFLSHMEEGAEKHGMRRGFIIIEAHSDCGAVKLVHSGEKLEEPESASRALNPIIQATDYAFRFFKRNAEELLNSVDDIVREAYLVAKTDLSKIFYPEIFYDEEVVALLKKNISPHRASLALHIFISLANAMGQILKLLTLRRIKDLARLDRLELLASFYDVFSAHTYFFIIDQRKYGEFMRYMRFRRELDLRGIDINIISLFERLY